MNALDRTAEKQSELLDRLERLLSPDRSVDLEIGALWPEPRPFNLSDATMRNGKPVCPAFTGSIDAIVSLIKARLPGWAYKMGTCSVSDDAWLVPDFNCPVHGERLLKQFGPVVAGGVWDMGIDVDRRPPGSIPIALCIALVDALEEVEAIG